MIDSTRFLFNKFLMFISLIFIGLSFILNSCISGKDPEPLVVNANKSEGKNIFSIRFPTSDIKEFEVFARQMERLKPYGRVDVSINNPAQRADFEIPEGGSPWHEYASYNLSVHIFFPDERLAPFLPADFVAKNRKLLMSKEKIVRESGLGVAWASTDPLLLPEAFFVKYPHLRGPRVDHPRRSLEQAFSACFHQEETIDMYKNMVNELIKNVPEINSFDFHINDAGSGMCWSNDLYVGANGPASCKNSHISEGVIAMFDVFKNTTMQITGRDVDIYFDGFTTEERIEIDNKLAERNTALLKDNYPSKNISSMLVSSWPVRGIMNPLQILRTLIQSESQPPFRYSLSFGDMYERGQERVETIEKVIDIVEDNLKNPSDGEGSDSLMAIQALKKICYKWAGEESSDQLFNAFMSLDQALNKRNKMMPRFSNTLYYLGVSARHITRPLVFVPGNLTADEEKYFLPHVFNVSVEEARNEYMDLHGADRFLSEGVVDSFLVDLKAVINSFEKIKNATEQKFLDDMARSLRIYYCVVRSCGNFNNAQIIRNRNREILAGPVHRPPKTPTRTGDPDLKHFNDIMRDEFDNTQDLIDLLENGGMDLVVHAKGAYIEDTFLLGADLIEQLKQKLKIMMAHWRDIEGYLSTPYI